MKQLLAVAVITSILCACGGGQTDVALNNEGRTPMLLAQATIVGGIATFSGLRQNYTITKSGTSFIVKDNVGSDGTQTVSNVTSLKFSDVSVNLVIADSASKISTANLNRLMELYVAFFNRVPDADGLNYWITQLIAGQSINQIAIAFYNAGVANSATTGYSPTMSNADFVNTVYKNVLGRSTGADAGGLAYWTGQLASGSATRGSLVASILDSVHAFKGDTTWGWVADLLDNKVAVAKFFAVDGGLTYLSPADSITKGMAIAAAITPTDTSAALKLISMPNTLLSTPIANAGMAQNVISGTLVKLDGSASSDANGDLLTYNWSLTSKPANSMAGLSSATSSTPTFTADLSGIYVASLVVSDGKVNSTVATVSVTASVANAAPMANAGVIQNVISGSTVTLDGSASSDDNGDQITYAWTLTSKPTGSLAKLTSATSVRPTFVTDMAGTYVASLVVNDGKVNSIAKTVAVTASVANLAPIARATTTYRYGATGTSVEFSGRQSTDANGDLLSYKWRLVSRPTLSVATLQNSTSDSPTLLPDVLGDYVVSLTTNDGKVDSENQSVLTFTAFISPIPTGSGIFASTLYIPVGIGGLDKVNSKITYKIQSSLDAGLNIGAQACDAFAATDVDESTGVVRALSSDGTMIYDIDIYSGKCLKQITLNGVHTAMATYRRGPGSGGFYGVYVVLLSSDGALKYLDRDGNVVLYAPIETNTKITGIDFDESGQLWGFGGDAIWKLDLSGKATRVAYNFGLSGATTNDIDIGSDGLMKVTSGFKIVYINLSNYQWFTRSYALQLGAIFSR